MANSPWSEIWDYTSPPTSGGTDLTKLFLYENFENGEEGQKVAEYTDFTAAGSGYTDTSESYFGSRCMRSEITPEMNGGWGQWGFTVRHPDLYDGDELWVRFAHKTSPGFDYKVNAGNLKYNRLRGEVYKTDLQQWTSDGTGYCDTFISGSLSNDTNPVRGLRQSTERAVPLFWDDSLRDYQITFDEWNLIELHYVIDSVSVDNGGTGKIDLWVNNEYVGEWTAHSTNVPIEPDNYAQGRRNIIYHLTYWNDDKSNPGAHPAQAQHMFIDHFTIAVKCAERDDSQYLSVDSSGKKYIGTKVLGPIEEGVDITQDITQDTVWPAGIYNVRNSIRIYADLTIESGSTVNFDTDAGFSGSSSGSITADNTRFITNDQYTASVTGPGTYTNCFFYRVRPTTGLRLPGTTYTLLDSILIDAWASVSRTNMDVQRNLFFRSKAPGQKTYLLSTYGDTDTNALNIVKDNVFVGGQWQTNQGHATYSGNVFITDENTTNQNDWNHESIIGMMDNNTWQNNLFIGDTFACMMSIGTNGGANSLVRNNTFYGTNDSFQWHLVEVDASGSQFRNNVIVGKSTLLHDEQSVPDRCVYTDYNAFDSVNDHYKKIFITGKTEGDPGFGANDINFSAATELVDVGYGWPHTITAQTIMDGTDTYQSIYDGYRTAYAPKPGSILIGAGDPQDGSPDIGFTGVPT